MVQIRHGFFVSTGILAVNSSVIYVIMDIQSLTTGEKYGKDDRKIQQKV